MSRKKLSGIFAAVALVIVVIISIGIIAAGGKIQAQAASATMKVSDNMLSVLKKLEGFNPHAYWDYKQYSIGYGSLCPAGKENYYLSVEDGGQGNQISEEDAEELLRGELEYFEREVNGFISHFGLTLAQNQYDALVSFSYNVGATWMRNTSTWEYKSTGNLNSAILSGDAGSHFIYGMMLWSMAGTPERHILINRRTVETNMYANGVYPENPNDASQAPSRYRIAFMDGNGGVVNYNEHGFDAEQPIAIKTQFKSKPVGPDETGVMVTYEFDGWYTERIGGTKVETLDTSIVTGTVLYAHWKTPGGTPVIIPKTNTGMKVTVTLTGNNVNVRSGPETYYQSLYKAPKGEVFEIEEVKYRGGMLWGKDGDKWVALMYTDYDAVIGQMLPMWGKVTSDTLNVRTGPGTGNALVSGVQKKKDDLVLVTEWKTDETIMWGKIAEGWIALPYVTFDDVGSPSQTVQSIAVNKNPNKLNYVHKVDALDLTGAKLLVTYADNTTSLVDITANMVAGFDNTKVGTNTLTVTYEGKTTTLNVEIVKAKVVFKLDDGTVISEQEYLYGDTVAVPVNPTKPADSNGYYAFVGWDKEVTVCQGDATYTAVFELSRIHGDIDNNQQVDSDDVVQLLLHISLPNIFQVDINVDFTGDGAVTSDDVVRLLLHISLPDMFPL